jgi:D-serine deaminase-like pyridoxal phosphate-dependent protein
MNAAYAISDTTRIFSPALIFYEDLIRQNISRAIEMAGSPARLRPHVKTHKTREIVALELAANITKHKCATIAEAEMLAGCGVPDVLVAYPMVGPNCARMAQLVHKYPDCRFSMLVDHPASARSLSDAMTTTGQRIDVLLDINSGQNRTGIAPGAVAIELYELIGRLKGLRPGGLHFYDGHQRQPDFHERRNAVQRQLEGLLAVRTELLRKGLPVPRVIVGGTPTFSIYVGAELPDVEYSPGTCVLFDHGYAKRFADLSQFVPAALLLTRVVSRPTTEHVTLDLGTKAVASDLPLAERIGLLDVPDYEPVAHNEEHLVIATRNADRFAPGDAVFAVAGHVCPTCALYRHAYVVVKGSVVGQWEIIARDRVLGI